MIGADKRRTGRQSLRTNVAISVVAFVVFVAAATSIVAAALIERSMKPTIGRQEYDLLRSAAVHIDGQLRQREEELYAFGQVLLPGLVDGTSHLRDQMLSQKKLTSHFANVGIVNANGDLLADLIGPVGRRINVGNRNYFREAIRTGKPAISQPLKSLLSGNPTVVVGVPIVISGVVKYVLIGGLDLGSSSLLEPLQTATLGETGFFFLMTSKGILISHPEPSRLLHDIREKPGFNLATERALQGYEGWIEATNKKGEPGIYSITRLHKVDWILVGRHPTEEAFSPITSLRTHAIVASLLFAMTAGIIVWLLARRLVQPIERLRSTVEAIESGRNAATTLQSTRSDEIGDLSNQFYRLVTAKEQSEAVATENESFIRALIQHAPDAVICCDTLGAVTEWNFQAQKMFGWTREEAIDLKIVDLIVPPRLRAQHTAGMHTFANSGDGQQVYGSFRFPAIKKDGTELQVELSLTSIPAGSKTIAIAFIRDVSINIEREELLASSERRLQMVADSMPALIAYVDQDQRYRFCNAYFRKSLGIEPSSMLGRTVFDVLGEKMYAQLEDKIALALAGELVHFEVSRDDPERTVHFMTDFIPDIQKDGQVHGFYSLVMDISERKEAELRQAASEQRAEAANKAKSAFVANISHEIRTPMNAVLGIAQLLANTPLREDQKDYLDIIQSSGLSLIAILNDVLDFSKIEADKLVLEYAPFDIEQVLEAAAAIFKASAGARDIDVAIGVSADVPRNVMGDSYRIQQIIANLISNAVKFTVSGHVTLKIDVLARSDKTMLRIVVGDSGIGISKEQHERMFQSFSQADTSTTRKFGGTGLGLAITKRLVEMMDGVVQLISAPDIGSEFTVLLPLRAAPNFSKIQTNPSVHILLIDSRQSTGNLFIDTAAFAGVRALFYKSETSAVDSALAGEYDLAQITNVLVGYQTMKRNPGIFASLKKFGLSSEASFTTLSTPFERRIELSTTATVATHIITKPITPKILRHSVVHLDGDTPSTLSPELHAGVSQLSVLLVEDNPVNQIVASGLLGGVVKSLDIAFNGADAVQKLREIPTAFDIIFMDIQMPIMDGLEATKIIRHELHMTTPIIAMTAGAMNDEREMCKQAGMNYFVAKPIIIQELYTVLNRFARTPVSTSQVARTQNNSAEHVIFQSRMLDSLVQANASGGSAVLKTVNDAIVRALQEIKQIENALMEGDIIKGLAALHSLRGGFSSLGTPRFAETAWRLEQYIRHHGIPPPEQISELSAQLSLAINELNNWAAGNMAVLNKSSVELPGADVTLDEFIELLKLQDVKASRAFEHLQNMLTAELPGPLFESLKAAVANLMFEEAIQILLAPREKLKP